MLHEQKVDHNEPILLVEAKFTWTPVEKRLKECSVIRTVYLMNCIFGGKAKSVALVFNAGKSISHGAKEFKISRTTCYRDLKILKAIQQRQSKAYNKL